MASHGPTGHEASMPATEHFAALQHQSRPRRWLFATMLDGATGVFAGLVLDWPLTLLAATTAHLERHGWTILRIPTTAPRDTAHHTYLLIGSGGVFVVEHQVWTVMETVTTSPTSGLLLVGGWPTIRRTASVRAAAAAVEDALSDTLPGRRGPLRRGLPCRAR